MKAKGEDIVSFDRVNFEDIRLSSDPIVSMGKEPLRGYQLKAPRDGCSCQQMKFQHQPWIVFYIEGTFHDEFRSAW